MRRPVMLLGVAVVCLLLTGPLGAESMAQTPASSACVLTSVDEPVDNPANDGSANGLLVPDYELELGEDFIPPIDRAEAASPSVPPCPVLRDCPLGNRCGNNRPCQLVGNQMKNNTGLQACDDGGSLVVCPAGQTIHTVTSDCSQCPCCSTIPACFCPINCGTALLKWGCA